MANKNSIETVLKTTKNKTGFILPVTYWWKQHYIVGHPIKPLFEFLEMNKEDINDFYSWGSNSRWSNCIDWRLEREIKYNKNGLKQFMKNYINKYGKTIWIENELKCDIYVEDGFRYKNASGTLPSNIIESDNETIKNYILKGMK